MNRIKQLRRENDLTLKKLSDKLKENNIKISSDSLAKYERGEREPKIDKWQALADFFNVSVPYLQGIEDKRNNGYTKKYIYQRLDEAYKNLWIGKNSLFGVDLIPAFYIEKYCKQNKINIPQDTDLKFWQNNFNFIFDYPEIKRLLTTKDEYSDEDIKELISLALFQKTTDKKFLSFIEKLNEQYLKNLQNNDNKKS
ncbi:helix-turn-helix domain-containing protein [Lactobacillus johnsonii]|uniref:helix-turn-helix domain-containing protein n=1 Tax=Lactobacillus johnsonii TaxID=33959 RepID=UPI003D783E2B